MIAKNRNILDPELKDVLDSLDRDINLDLNCVKIGQINKFDPEKKTAEIQILFKILKQDETSSSYSVLVDCPIFTLQGGGSSLQMPIEPGDNCIVLFSDRNIDNWYRTGSEGIPFDGRTHSLSDAIALVGVNALTSNLENYVSEQTRLIYGDSIITIKKDGEVRIDVTSGKKFIVDGGTAAEILGTLSLALLSELNSFITTYNTHTHAETGSVTGIPNQPGTPGTGTQKLKGS